MANGRARKREIRQRMAETGENYTQAMRAIEKERPGPPESEGDEGPHLAPARTGLITFLKGTRDGLD